jgi:hypothetical protein
MSMSILTLANSVHRLQYARLESLKPQVRLLTLYRSPDYNDEIRCKISAFYHYLPDCSRYEALSYTWGDAGDVCQIIVNDHNIEVTAQYIKSILA